MTKRTTSTSEQPILIRAKYRSRLEEKIAEQLERAKIAFTYESKRYHFKIPERIARYTPDFHFGNIVIEAKGRFFNSAEDRQRVVLFREQNPEVDLRFVFQDAKKPIYKGSKTTYSAWAESHGIPWADKGVIPEQWIKEANDFSRISTVTPAPVPKGSRAS